MRNFIVGAIVGCSIMAAGAWAIDPQQQWENFQQQLFRDEQRQRQHQLPPLTAPSFLAPWQQQPC